MQLGAQHSYSTDLGLAQYLFFSDFGEFSTRHIVLLLPVVCIGGEAVSNTCNQKHL